MNEYGYEYFCGANVVVEVDSMPILECSGLRISLMESKRPIYGYSSRHFDAVANGQVLVEGSLLINYVHHDYLFEAIQLGGEKLGILPSDPAPPFIAQTGLALNDLLADEKSSKLLINRYADDPINNAAVAEALQRKFWDTSTVVNNDFETITRYNPHDIFGSVSLRVTFGNKDIYNFGAGVTHFTIDNVHFLGRGTAISIDEQVIVEEYPFFARNISSKTKVLRTSTEFDASGDTVTISTQ